jgi:uncharacterized protein
MRARATSLADEGETSVSTADVQDLRGRMFRAKRQMPDEEARDFLKQQKTAHVGTADRNGWPYVVPLVYIYQGGDSLYLHTGNHQGHFLTNVQHNPRICVQVSEIGPLHKGKRFACDSALVYSSVIVYGAVQILAHDREKKSWFLDRLLEKYGDPSFQFEPGYPLIDNIILYEQKIEILTGKRSEGLYH